MSEAARTPEPEGAQAALDLARQHGVKLWVEGGRVRWKCDKTPPREIIEALRQHKASILDALNSDRATWADGVARLKKMEVPSVIQPLDWRAFVVGAEAFMSGDWPVRLQELGWQTLDLFGCDPTKPRERIDRAGLVWFLGAHDLVAATGQTAVIAAPMGQKLTYRRHPPQDGDVPAWELA